MKDTKLTRLLRTFSSIEWKEFEKFAASPYHNKGRNYRPFLKQLKKYFPDFDSGKLTKEHIYKNLYPGKPYKDTVINTIASGMYALAEEFLVQECFNKNKLYRDSLLIKELSIKNLKLETEKLIENTGKKLLDTKIGDSFYFDQYNIYSSIIKHYVNCDEQGKIIEYVTKGYLNSLELFINDLLSDQRTLFVNKTHYKTPFEENPVLKTIKFINVEGLVGFLNTKDELRILPIIQKLYYQIAVNHPDETNYYFKLKEMTLNYFNNMETDLKKSSCIQLCSICLNNIFLGKSEFHREFSEVYKIILKYGLYYNIDSKGYFSNRLFRAIIFTSIYLKELGWAEKFVNEYIKKIHPDIREQLYHNCLARIEFARKNYEKALFHATRIEYKDILYKQDAKSLIAKIYYETNAIESLASLIDSYKHLMKNSKLLDKNYEKSNFKFIKFLESIAKLKYNTANPDEISFIKTEIENTKTLNHKGWLIAKIEELENK